jgi:hypothetical protein
MGAVSYYPLNVFIGNRRAANMKFGRYEIRMEYSLVTLLQGSHIQTLHDPALRAAGALFSVLESSFIYLPMDKSEFVAGARTEFARHDKPVPHEFDAPIQYFVNSQLYYTAHRAIGSMWHVEREARYRSTSKHRADVRIAVTADEHSDHAPFNIWVETDHAIDSRVLRKNWEKALIVQRGDSGGRDIFVQFFYRAIKFDRLGTMAAALTRNIRSLGTRMSFVVAYITPGYLRAHEVIDSDLVLFKDASLRVNDCYFHGWTREGDYCHLNERRVDRGIQFTGRAPRDCRPR